MNATPKGGTRTAAVQRVATCSALVSLLVVSAGCSSSGSQTADSRGPSSSSRTVDSDFATRVGAVCAPYAQSASRSYLRLPGFNRYAPDARLLPRVAAHLEKDRVYTELRPELQALGKPRSGEATWATVLDGYRSTERDVKLQIASARGGDAARFTDLVTRLQEDTTALRARLRAAGLSDSSCIDAEGDPLRAPSAFE